MSSSSSSTTTVWEKNEEIQIFREYLRIPTVHPNVDYTKCVEFLKRQAASLQLPVEVIYPVVETKPVVLMKWQGTNPDLPAILLNSHTDVVPVFADKWTHPPFAADIDGEGKIYARGAQDMKCVGTQYLGAIRALKASGYQPKRTIYLSYVPEEEIGGGLGMRDWIQMPSFKQLNIGFSLDEGIATPDASFSVYYAERTLWHVQFQLNGNAGHGSLLLPNTAGEKLNFIVGKLMAFRASQVEKLAKDPSIDIGDVTTVNLTKTSGGVQSNVVPPQLLVTFDIRMAITVDVAAFKRQLYAWCEEAGGDIDVIFEEENPEVAPTKIDATNPFWTQFKSTIDDLGLSVKPRVFPGATDSRFIRHVGIPALGFSPMNNTPVLLHDHDEFLQADIYLRGIEIYKKLIPSLANA